MSRKLNSVSAILAFAVLVLAVSSAMAQMARVRPNTDETIIKAPTLGCCKCLGGTNTLDLSTLSSNNWTVTNGGITNPAVFLAGSQINSAWNINPGPAQWVSTSASSGTGSGGDFDYKLNFVIPDCAIRQSITLAGSYGGDNNVALYLDSITGANLIAQCAGNWCFSTSHQPLPTFSKNVNPGPHALIVRVNNVSGPSGMFINAKLTGNCKD
jgi:hypothetical protein